MSQYLSISSLYSQSCNFAMFFTVPPQIFVSHIFEELCIEDVVQVLQLHRKTFEIGEFYQRVLRFALRRLAFGLGRCKTSLKTWLQIFEALKAGNFESNCADLQRLNGLISFKHTRYCTERGDYVQPLPWSFRAGSVEPFIRFLWRECTASTSPFPSIRAATFVEVLGGEKKTILQRPLAIIALDATYCENGVKDEFFNMATLLLLDDLKVALLLAWAVDIQEKLVFILLNVEVRLMRRLFYFGNRFQMKGIETAIVKKTCRFFFKRPICRAVNCRNEGFFAIVLIGNQLVEVMNYASKIFEAPAWTWKGNELAHWFGFDMTKVASFEDKIEILEKFPRINSAIQTALFRDLERFVRHMHNLRPGFSVSQAERWKKTASPNPSHCGPYEVSRQVKDVMSTVSVSGRFMPFMMFAVQSVFATCSLQFVLRHSSLPMSHVVCVIKCVCPVSGMHGEGRYEWPDGRAYEGMLWQFIQSFKLWNILTKTHIKWCVKK